MYSLIARNTVCPRNTHEASSFETLHSDGILRQTQAMNYYLINQEAFSAETTWSEAGASISGVTSSD